MARLNSLLVASLFGLAFAACSQDAPDDVLTGYIRADYVYAAPVEGGRVMELNVAEGESVEKGALLFVLDDTAQRAQLAQAKAQLSQADATAANLGVGARPEEIDALRAQLKDAQTQLAIAVDNFNRENALVATGAVSTSRVDQLQAVRDSAEAKVEAAEKQIAVARLPARTDEQKAAQAAVDAARASVEQAEWALNERRIYADRAGRVELILRREGEIAGPSAPAIAILPPDRNQLRFYVPQDQLSSIALGDSVSVAADGVASPVSAKIVYISNEAEFTPPVIYSNDMRDKLVFAVDAQLPADAGLHPGLPVDVKLP